MNRRRVVVLGDVMLDVIVQPIGPLAPTSDTAANIRVTRGGSGANLAMALSATGHDVLYVGARGDDAASRIFVEALDKGGVSTRLQIVDSPTGTVVAIIAEDGQRAMMTDRGANTQLSDVFVAQELQEPFDHLHLSGYLLLDVATRSVGERALEMARARGISTSVDVCSLAPLMKMTPAVFLASVEGASMLFANEEEALTLTAASDAESALATLAGLFGEVVITRSELGVLCALGEHHYFEPAMNVAVLDTTGAGDAATGTYLGERLHGNEPKEALEAAMAASARVIGGLGALG